MAIPFNDCLKYDKYLDVHSKSFPARAKPADDGVNQVRRAVHAVFIQTFRHSLQHGEQFLRDAARLVLKVPVRAIREKIWLQENWSELERAKINAKLTAYSLAQLASTPFKTMIALAALTTTLFSSKKAAALLNASEDCTAYLNGRAAQLEALKEEGRKKAPNKDEYLRYQKWVYEFDPKLCYKEKPSTKS